jgi:hypothetical protein
MGQSTEPNGHNGVFDPRLATDRAPKMTSREYLLSQAEHCRRTADDIADRFIAEELKRMAQNFEAQATGAAQASGPARYPA